MKVWLDASYFHHGAVHAAPSWVLLDKKGGYANCDNATTAYAITSAGSTIKVTFCLASPPSVSHLCVHQTDSKQHKDLDVLDAMNAEVCSSSMGIVLLRCRSLNDVQYEYFVYHTAAGKPSLRAIPSPPMPSRQVPCFGILPLVSPCGEFLLAYLTVEKHPRLAYDLCVFSSKTWAWSTRALTLTPLAGVRPDDLPREFDKVIALGGNLLGWVDLLQGGGIIACDVLDEDPAASTRFIPLPKSDFYKRWYRSDSYRQPIYRDVACYRDGFIVYVDLDLRFRYVALDNSNDEKKPVIKTVRDLDHMDAILDSELIHEEDIVHVAYVPDGWKIRTCYRNIAWNYWRKGHIVDVDDITIYNPVHRTMLSELWDGGAGRWALRKLKSKRPMPSMQGGDVVYLTVVSKKGQNGRQIGNSKTDNQKLTVGIHLGKKTMEMLEPYYGRVFQPCTPSQHVDTPPPPQENMWNIDGYYNGGFHGYAHAVPVHAGYGYGSYQHPLLWSPSVPQHLDPSLNSLGSGYIYPVNVHSTYPVPMMPMVIEYCHLCPTIPPTAAAAPETGTGTSVGNLSTLRPTMETRVMDVRLNHTDCLKLSSYDNN